MAPDHFVFGLCFRAATKKFARRAKIGVVRSQTHGMARGDQLYRRTPREKGKDVKIAPLSPGSVIFWPQRRFFSTERSNNAQFC
jgi:hypothetical protein